MSTLRIPPVALALVLCAAGAAAAVARTGQARSARSPSGAWSVQVLPGDGSHPPRARLAGPKGEALVYELAFEIAPADVLVLDDGLALYFDEWRRMGQGTAACAHGSAGERLWTRSISELVPAEALARVPESFGARVWRTGTPTLRESETSKREVRVPLWNADELALDPLTGEARWIAIEDHGGDADAWAASARDLLRQKQTEAAAAEFERALGIAPDRVRVWNELAELWTAAGGDARALAALERGVAKNPLGEQPVDRFSEASGRAWLLFRLARAYERGGDVEKAQAAAQRVLAADPSSWPAAHMRAEHLALQGATAELDALLARTYAALLGGEGDANRARRRSQAALYVGGFYAERERWREARDYLARGLDGAYSEPLHLALARAHEALGERERAMELLTRVVEELLVAQSKLSPEAARANQARVEELEAEIARLAADDEHG